MKRTIAAILLCTLLLGCFVGCSGRLKATLTYIVDGEEFYKDTVVGANDYFGSIGTVPEKGGFVFNGWYFDDGVWEKPLSYTDLNAALTSTEYRVYAKWENVDLKFNETTRTYSVVGLLLDAGSDIVIPATYKDFPVTEIAAGAFRGNTSLSSIVIPDTVTTIGEYAFAECTALKEIRMPNSVVTVGKGAFSNCASLTSVTVSTALKQINAETFYNCSALTEITLPQALVQISPRAFASCTALTSFTIPFRVISLGAEMLSGIGLTEISYAGNTSDFEKIAKEGFLDGSSVKTVRCLNGDISY